MKITTCTVCLLAILALSTSTSHAQIVYGQKAHLTSEFLFQSWELEGATHTTNLSQWVFPIFCFLPVKDNYEVRILTSAAATSLDKVGEKNNLNGLNDTKLQAAGSFLDDRYLVSLGINLPSGKKSLDREETQVVQFVSLDFLNLPAKNFGEGFNLNLSLARAFEWRNLVWGVGTGYQYNGKYEPYYNLSDYKPGNQVHLIGGVSSEARRAKFTADMAYIIYQIDTQGGERIFRNGNQFDVRVNLTYAEKKFAFHAQTRLIMRAKDRRYGRAKVYLQETKNHGNDFRFSTSLSYQAKSKVNLLGIAEVKIVGANEYPASHDLHLGSSHIVGFGAGLKYTLGDNYRCGLLLKGFRGSADGGDLTLSGFQMQTSLLIGF